MVVVVEIEEEKEEESKKNKKEKQKTYVPEAEPCLPLCTLLMKTRRKGSGRRSEKRGSRRLRPPRNAGRRTSTGGEVGKLKDP